MKLSVEFVEVLKNFSEIHQGLVVKPGKTLRTISSDNSIRAEYQCSEEFFKEFGIYDLNKTLGILSLNKKDPEVEIEDESLIFKSLAGTGSINQRFSDPSLVYTKEILKDFDKNPKIKEYDITVDLTDETFKWIFNAASILKCPNIVIKGDVNTITIYATDVKGHLVDSAKVHVDGKANCNFEAVLKIQNLKVLSGTYVISISKLGVAKFTHKSKKLTYWIAVENSSKFGE